MIIFIRFDSWPGDIRHIIGKTNCKIKRNKLSVLESPQSRLPRLRRLRGLRGLGGLARLRARTLTQRVAGVLIRHYGISAVDRPRCLPIYLILGCQSGGRRHRSDTVLFSTPIVFQRRHNGYVAISRTPGINEPFNCLLLQSQRFANT